MHVNNILGKLGAEDRTQMVTSAPQRGIIHLDELPYRSIDSVLHRTVSHAADRSVCQEIDPLPGLRCVVARYTAVIK